LFKKNVIQVPIKIRIYINFKYPSYLYVNDTQCQQNVWVVNCWVRQKNVFSLLRNSPRFYSIIRYNEFHFKPYIRHTIAKIEWYACLTDIIRFSSNRKPISDNHNPSYKIFKAKCSSGCWNQECNIYAEYYQPFLEPKLQRSYE